MESGPRAMSILRLQNRRHCRGAARRLGCTAGTCETRWSFDWLILFILMKVFTCSIVAVLLWLLALKTFVIGYYQIPQNGMYPTLPAGSVLFTLKHAYRDVSRVKRGDIIVFLREQNGRRYNYIWRVIGFPGDKVQTAGEFLILKGLPGCVARATRAGGETDFHEEIDGRPRQRGLEPR